MASVEPSKAALRQLFCGNPTVTSPRINTLLTGQHSSYMQVVLNFNTHKLTAPNLVTRLAAAGFSTGFVGDNTWTALLPDAWTLAYPFRSFDVQDTTSVDEGIEKYWPELVSLPQPSLIVAHTLGLDHVEHMYGIDHERVEDVMAKTDRLVESMIRQLSDRRTLILVMGDHGMTASGSHGGASSAETHSGLFFMTNGTLPDLPPTVTQASVGGFIESSLGLGGEGIKASVEGDAGERDPPYEAFITGVIAVSGVLFMLTIVPAIRQVSTSRLTLWEVGGHVLLAIGCLSNCFSESSHQLTLLFAVPLLPLPALPWLLTLAVDNPFGPVAEFGRLTPPAGSTPTPAPPPAGLGGLGGVGLLRVVGAAHLASSGDWFSGLAVLARAGVLPIPLVYIIILPLIMATPRAVHTLRLLQANTPTQIASAIIPSCATTPIIADLAFFLWGAHYSLTEVDPSPAWLGLTRFTLMSAAPLLGAALFGPHATTGPGTVAIRSGRCLVAAGAAYLLRSSLMSWSVFAPRAMFEAGVLLVVVLAACRRKALQVAMVGRGVVQRGVSLG